MDKDSIVFYRSFFEAINKLPRDIQLDAYDAIMQYAFNDRLAEVPEMAKVVFILAKPQIDANYQRYANGKKGGAPKGNRNARKQPSADPDINCGSEIKQPNVNEKGNEKEKGNENEKENSSCFIPPSPEQVREYCEQRKNSVSPERFIDYYSANGWMVGRNQMKDWQAAIRTWEQNEAMKKEMPKIRNSFNDFEQRNYDYDEIERKLLNQKD